MGHSYYPLENEKAAPANLSSQPGRPVQRKSLQRLLPATLVICAVVFLFKVSFVCHENYDPAKEMGLFQSVREDTEPFSSRKIALEAHIMSKCPDARDCLQMLVVPTMEQVSEKVDFRLSYIGSFDEKSDAVACMHGPSECLGNMIELCAARIYPDPKIYLGFANCMSSNYSQIADREYVESCALEHGVDFERVNKCISEEGHGSGLLRESMLRSHEANVTKSCTVRVQGEVRCIRDGGKWYDCPGGSGVSDLVRDIERLYNEDS